MASLPDVDRNFLISVLAGYFLVDSAHNTNETLKNDSELVQYLRDHREVVESFLRSLNDDRLLEEFWSAKTNSSSNG